MCVWASGAAAAAALRAALPHGTATLRLQRARAARVRVHLPDARGIALQHGKELINLCKNRENMKVLFFIFKNGFE